jgi:hypothetical protein
LALFPFKRGLIYAIREIQENQKFLKLNETLQLLANDNDVYLLRENKNTICLGNERGVGR